jgi:hypothetical protein
MHIAARSFGFSVFLGSGFRRKTAEAFTRLGYA